MQLPLTEQKSQLDTIENKMDKEFQESPMVDMNIKLLLINAHALLKVDI